VLLKYGNYKKNHIFGQKRLGFLIWLKLLVIDLILSRNVS